ncbi:ATP-binding protein [Amycolatopsis kentuckyensis]|uniref:ATP-binding protein n=1 Tax=Amycolatopsis kentuckyensis TaxID=218823 RepID=UPI003567A02B
MDPDFGTFYVRRWEENEVLEQVRLVRTSSRSRAVLLYGPGGVGKTRMVRALAARDGVDPAVRWIRPIDIDDSQYWLLAGLQRTIVASLDPQQRYFADFLDHTTRLPGLSVQQVGKAAMASHHRRSNELFSQGYGDYIASSGQIVVITLDTVETMRSTFLLVTLAQWMKALPGTLFVLSGRPAWGWETHDPIRDQLAVPPGALETAEITLAGFDEADALTFLDRSILADSLSRGQKSRLVALTGGHPLWLALAVDYLQHFDPPPEMAGDDQVRGKLREAFRRRLVTPYRSSEFWPEAIKRLSVVRHSIDEQLWRALMADRELPPNAGGWSNAWQQLLARPWIRPRANERYITLHDALAEELAHRLIPLHDQDESWRRHQWKTAASSYESLCDAEYSEVIEAQTQVFKEPAASARVLFEKVARLDVRKRELDQLRAAGLYYRLLTDFEAGTARFTTEFGAASKRDDVHFQELACHELERFLPPATPQPPLEDAIGVVVDRFRAWLVGQPQRYLGIGLDVARFLRQASQPEAALALLSRLPEAEADTPLKYRLANERGNAWLGIPGKVERAQEYFDEALAYAGGLPSPQREHLRAQSYKELGFYCRNLGKWQEADQYYRDAYEVIVKRAGPGATDRDREELASIQANWAYLKALQGSYDEARNLVEPALAVRRKLGTKHAIAVSLSVSAEVYRYERKFSRAWDQYRQAEGLFIELHSGSWLGLVHQEEAICLMQAHEEGLNLVEKPMADARRLICSALDICRDYGVRWYPSALNRAGRIFGEDDPDAGLRHLDHAIAEARRLADGWFLSASLIEYLELTYRAWCETGEDRYRRLIHARVEDVAQAIRDYQFDDLEARWQLLQGHLELHDSLTADGSESLLDNALDHYSRGFLILAGARIGSHGAAAIAAEFERFHQLFAKLTPDVQSEWYTRLRERWTSPETSSRSTSLLARLEQLY